MYKNYLDQSIQLTIFSNKRKNIMFIVFNLMSIGLLITLLSVRVLTVKQTSFIVKSSQSLGDYEPVMVDNFTLHTFNSSVFIYLLILMICTLVLFSRYTPRKTGIMYILLASKLLFTLCNVELYLSQVFHIAFSAVSPFGMMSLAIEINPLYTLIKYIVSFSLILTGSFLLFSKKESFCISSNEKSPSTDRLFPWVNLLSYWGIIFLIMARVFYSYFLYLIITTVVEQNLFTLFLLSFRLTSTLAAMLITALLLLLFKNIKEPYGEVRKSINLTPFTRQKKVLVLSTLVLWLWFCNAISALYIPFFIFISAPQKQLLFFFYSFLSSGGIFLYVLGLFFGLRKLVSEIKNRKKEELDYETILSNNKDPLVVESEKPAEKRYNWIKGIKSFFKKKKIIQFSLFFRSLMIIPLLFFPFEMMGFFSLTSFVIPSNLDYSNSFGLNSYINRSIDINECELYENGSFLLTFTLIVDHHNAIYNTSVLTFEWGNELLYPSLHFNSFIFDFTQNGQIDQVLQFLNISFVSGPQHSDLNYPNSGNTTAFIQGIPGIYTFSGSFNNTFLADANITIALGDHDYNTKLLSFPFTLQVKPSSFSDLHSLVNLATKKEYATAIPKESPKSYFPLSKKCFLLQPY